MYQASRPHTRDLEGAKHLRRIRIHIDLMPAAQVESNDFGKQRLFGSKVKVSYFFSNEGFLPNRRSQLGTEIETFVQID